MKIAEIEVTLDPNTGYASVPVLLRGPASTFEANLILDTGAAQTTLSTSLASPLGFHLAGLPRETFLAAGGESSARLALLREVSLFGTVQPKISSRFVDLGPIDGLLGNDLLEKFNLLVVVDVRKGFAKLILRSSA